jgi:outer membrane protein TolC
VLQAKTALAQAQLALQQDEGQMEVIRGALATAMGLPAELPVDAAPLDENVPVQAAGETIERELGRALSERPELLAARARALAAEQRIRQERSAGLPSLNLASAGSRLFYESPDRSPANNYSAALQLRVPLFSGFEHRYNVERARAEAAQAHADAETLENDVRLQVFTSYYDLQTASLRFHTAGDLLAAAEENERVASGRYHEGVGSILDVLQAQSALANARAQRILSRADWLLSLAQLAHDTGALAPAPAAPAPNANTTAPTPR